MAWHTTTQIGDNVYRISEPIGAIEPRFGVTTVNMYLVIGRERAALIDSGSGHWRPARRNRQAYHAALSGAQHSLSLGPHWRELAFR